MKKHSLNDRMVKKIEIGMDFMNRNAIVSLAMLCAYSEINHQDLLDLIAPFVFYAVGKTTRVGAAIELNDVCVYVDEQFAFKGIQESVVKKILERDKARIKRRHHQYYLACSLSEHVDRFDKERTKCKEKSDIVTSRLTSFLNEEIACGRANYTQAECETLLLTFFDRKGNDVLQSVETLYQMTKKADEINFYIAKFILEEFQKDSVIMSYIDMLVKGYYVTSAIYLHADNANIKKSGLKNVTFYLDTRILLALLGLKSKEENGSIKAAIKILQKHGAKLACFDYNLDEVGSILEAYRNQLLAPYGRPSRYTLEFLDDMKYSPSQVGTILQTFRITLRESCHVESGEVDSLTEYLDERRVIELLQQIRPGYNTDKLADDIYAINVVKQKRRGRRPQEVETCEAVFVTANTAFIKAIKLYMKESGKNGCFPYAISADDLCVLAWIKDFKQSDDIPKMRLLENVTAAINPSMDLMNAFFDQLEVLKDAGEFSDDDVAQLRMNAYARYELMEITKGSKDAVTSNAVAEIYARVNKKAKEQGYEEGRADAERKAKQFREAERNNACKRIRENLRSKYEKKLKMQLLKARILVWCVAIIFTGATIISFISSVLEPGMKVRVAVSMSLVAVVSWVQAVMPLLNKENFITRKIKRRNQRKMDDEIDEEITRHCELYD